MGGDVDIEPVLQGRRVSVPPWPWAGPSGCVGQDGRRTGTPYTRASTRNETKGPRHGMDVITAEGLVKVYKTRRSEVRALDGIDRCSATGR